MAKVTLNMPAPDFTLNDVSGKPVTLSSFQGQKVIVLVFNRGFV